MKAKITIELNIPQDFEGSSRWNKKTCLDDYIHHWLEQGYFIEDYSVKLPKGISYEGFSVEYPQEWNKKV